MSALGQKQTCAVQYVMSALPPIADMAAAPDQQKTLELSFEGFPPHTEFIRPC